MTTLIQTLTLTYPQDARVLAGNVLWNYPGGQSRGRELREVLWALGDVRGKCSDTIPEWHMRNLVTLEGTMTKAFTNNCSTRLIHSWSLDCYV